VSVSPRFEPDHSDPSEPRFVFSYRIRIRNESDIRAQLLSRDWKITDGRGVTHLVRGDGVVGHQPDLSPGQGFEYSSFCPLPTDWGTMEGAYTMETVNPDGSRGERFQIEVGRFYLMT
jgi:ApaG protein